MLCLMIEIPADIEFLVSSAKQLSGTRLTFRDGGKARGDATVRASNECVRYACHSVVSFSLVDTRPASSSDDGLRE